MRKEVIFETHAWKEFLDLPEAVRNEFESLISFLESRGELREPEAKKIGANRFELRVRVNGQWRALYAYYLKDKIIIIRFFQKKTQKTPLKEIALFNKRLKSLGIK